MLFRELVIMIISVFLMTLELSMQMMMMMKMIKFFEKLIHEEDQWSFLLEVLNLFYRIVW